MHVSSNRYLHPRDEIPRCLVHFWLWDEGINKEAGHSWI